MSNKVVSIITPSFNRAYIVHETAASIFNQTYPHWEWMIVDDGSTDESMEVLRAYAQQDSRVKVLQRHRDPKGACACRNIAIENATGDYLIFLDTDDVLAPYCLQQRVNAMEKDAEYDFIIFPMMLFSKKLDDLNLLWNIETGEDDLVRILKGDAICQGTGTLWKKSKFVEIGMWHEELKLWQDIELHIRSLLWPVKFKKRMDLLPDVFLRVSDDSLSRVGYNALPKIQSRIKVLTYTCQRMNELGVLQKYKTGVRVMANSIIIAAIKGGHYAEAASTINYCRSIDLYSKREVKLMRNYLASAQFKLSRIPYINNYFSKKIESIVPATEENIGKHKLQLNKAFQQVN